MTFLKFCSFTRLFVIVFIPLVVTSCTTYKRNDPSPVGMWYPNAPVKVELTKDNFFKSDEVLNLNGSPIEIKSVGQMTWNSLIGHYSETALLEIKFSDNSSAGYYATISFLQKYGRVEYTGSKTYSDFFWGKGGWGWWLKILGVVLLALYLFSGFTKVPTGHKGITIWFGKRSERIFNEGLAWHLPLFSTIEIIDCKVRFIEERSMTVTLAHFITVNLKTSVSYRISNPHNYLDNHSITDLDGKIKTYVTDSLRQYFTKNQVTENEILAMDTAGYKKQQIEKINKGYLKNLGIEITDIVVGIIEITQEMRTFFEILRQADLLHDKLPYKDALEKALLINGKIGQTNFHLTIDGLTHLKRLTALG